MALNDKIYDEIQFLCGQGDDLSNEEEYELALEKYNQALSLIPDPFYEYEAATWIYTAIGDTLYLMEDYQNAVNHFQQAIKCPDGIGNPFIVLRLGECFFEASNFQQARNYLLQAYMLDGEDVFEDSEQKYFNFIKDLI